MRISDWSSDVCSSDLIDLAGLQQDARGDVLCGSGTFDPPTTKLDANGHGSPYATYGFAAQIAEMAVDLDLGMVKVLRMAAAHDVGRAEIGRAHVCTPVTNAQLVSRLLLSKTKR